MSNKADRPLNDPIRELMRVFTQTLLEQFETTVPAALNPLFPDTIFTLESAIGLALAVYATIISIPFPIVQMMGGVLIFAQTSRSGVPEMFTAQAVTDRFKRISGHLSPTFSAALTPELITLAAQLMLYDLLFINPNPDEIQLKKDSQHYLLMALEYLGIEIDADAAMSEAQSFIQSIPLDMRRKFNADKPNPFEDFVDGLDIPGEE